MSSKDRYDTPQAGGQQPPAKIVIVDISSADFVPNFQVRGFAMDALGALKVDAQEVGTGVVLTSGMFNAGMWHPLQITKVYKTGTGAQNIVLGG
jgi:hypothetical protein